MGQERQISHRRTITIRDWFDHWSAGLLTDTEFLSGLENLDVRGCTGEGFSYTGYDYTDQCWITI